MIKGKENLDSCYAHVSNGGVRATLKEQSSNIKEESSFFLEFSLSNFGTEMSVEIPVNKDMCLFLALVLTQRLEHIEYRDSKYNTNDTGMFEKFTKKYDKEINISKEADAFRHFARSFEEYVKNSEIIK